MMESPSKWLQFLPWVEFFYNTSFYFSIGFTLFQIVYGRLPPIIPQYTSSSSSIKTVDSLLLQRDLIIRQLKDNLAATRNSMK